MRVQVCFCLSSVDSAVSKTKGQTLTNAGFLANTLMSNSYSSLPLSITHKHQLFCLQQRKPVLVWSQRHTTKMTSWRRNGKQGRDRWKERGAEQNSCHCPRAFLSLSTHSHHKHTPWNTHNSHQCSKRNSQVTDDHMKGDAVNFQVDQRGLPPLRIWLSKYLVFSHVSLWHTYSAED